jgi:tetratricopeptide (TPR) repeat protein
MAATRDLPSGTVTFLHAGADRGERLDERLADGLAEGGATVIDRRGDAVFAAFATAGAALDAAVAAQRGLGTLRIGVHTGEVIIGERGYAGEAVHHAPALAELAHAGQILLSRTAAALVEHELDRSTRLRDLGEVALPGLGRRERVFQVLAEGLPESFPRLVAPAPAPGPPPGPPLLERELELAAVREHVAAAVAGDGRLLAIRGGAGIGKTRLLAEARAAAAKRGLTVLAARGGELEHDFAFGIARQLFEPLLATATTAERAELLAGPAAPAAGLIEIVEPAGDDEREGASLAILHGLYWLAANLALRRPAVLAIDDLHWADAPSLRWLLHLQRRLEGLPLLVLVATRPPSQGREEQLVTEIVGNAATRRVEPAALGRGSITVLARAVFGAEPAEEFVAACHAATGGNPLFVDALLDTLHGDGVEPAAASAPRVVEVGPEPVRRAVTLRLSRVSSAAQALARSASVLGGRAQLEHAAALAGLTRAAAARAAAELARVEILSSDEQLEFAHPVVRAVVYDDLRPPERLAAHRRAADVLAKARAEPEQIAVQLEHSEPAGDAFVVATLRRAAERALRRGASEVAVSFLRRALREPPGPDEYAEVVRALGLAERLVDNDAAIGHLAEAFDALDGSPGDGRVALELGRALQRANRHAEAIDALRRGRAVVRDDADTVNSLTAELIGAAWWDPEDLPLAEAELAQARALELDDSYGAHLLRATLAYAEARVGDDRGYALGLAREAMASGTLSSAGSRGLYSLGHVFTVCGETDVTIALYDRASLEALRRGDYVLASGCVLFRAIAQLYEGNLAAAEEDVRRVPELAELQIATPYHAAFGAWAALERGALEEAERLLAAPEYPEELPRLGQFLWVQLVRGRLRLERRELDAAVRDLLRLGEHSRALGHRKSRLHPVAALRRAGAARNGSQGGGDRARPLGARPRQDVGLRLGDGPAPPHARARRGRQLRRAAPPRGRRSPRRHARTPGARQGPGGPRRGAPAGEQALRLAGLPPRRARACEPTRRGRSRGAGAD